MKTTSKKIISLLMASAMVWALSSCKKDKDKTATPNETANKLDAFFDQNAAKSQYFTVNVGSGPTTITGAEGTSITIPQGAFVDGNGNPITGNVSVEMKEIYDKADMVLTNKVTVSGGQLLVSGGEIYINATQNGLNLSLEDSTFITITLPYDTRDSGMTTFVSDTSADGVVNWEPIPTDTVSPNGVTPDSSGNVDGNYFWYDPSNYILTINQLGWINCDRFYNVPNTTITINTNATSTDNLRAYLVFKNINSVAAAYAYSGSLNAYGCPIGEVVTLVVFDYKDGKEYFGQQEVTITSSGTYTVNLTEMSEAQIKSALLSLN